MRYFSPFPVHCIECICGQNRRFCSLILYLKKHRKTVFVLKVSENIINNNSNRKAMQPFLFLISQCSESFLLGTTTSVFFQLLSLQMKRYQIMLYFFIIWYQKQKKSAFRCIYCFHSLMILNNSKVHFLLSYKAERTKPQKVNIWAILNCKHKSQSSLNMD